MPMFRQFRPKVIIVAAFITGRGRPILHRPARARRTTRGLEPSILLFYIITWQQQRGLPAIPSSAFPSTSAAGWYSLYSLDGDAINRRQ